MSWDEENFGNDDGIICDCGGETFRTDSQRGNLNSYECVECGESFQVQFENDDYDDYDDYDEIYL